MIYLHYQKIRIITRKGCKINFFKYKQKNKNYGDYKNGK